MKVNMASKLNKLRFLLLPRVFGFTKNDFLIKVSVFRYRNNFPEIPDGGPILLKDVKLSFILSQRIFGVTKNSF